MAEKKLSERRAVDREKMAQAIESIVQGCGATSYRQEGLESHEVWVQVEAARGLRVTVEFDADSPQPGVHLLAWNIHHSSDARLNPATFGEVNQYHHRKATHVAHGFEDLCAQLKKGLHLAANGEAFLET